MVVLVSGRLEHSKEEKTRMSTVLAAEGGYQEFVLGTAEWAWLIISVVTALIALGVGFLLSRGVLKADQGTEKMKEIAAAPSRKAPWPTCGGSSRRSS